MPATLGIFQMRGILMLQPCVNITNAPSQVSIGQLLHARLREAALDFCLPEDQSTSSTTLLVCSCYQPWKYRGACRGQREVYAGSRLHPSSRHSYQSEHGHSPQLPFCQRRAGLDSFQLRSEHRGRRPRSEGRSTEPSSSMI